MIAGPSTSGIAIHGVPRAAGLRAGQGIVTEFADGRVRTRVE